MSLALALAVVASAHPQRPFPRADDALETVRYREVRGEGPVEGHRRRKGGPIEAWQFPDGQIEHYLRWRDDLVVETHRFDAAGHPLTSYVVIDGVETVRVHRSGATLDVGPWTGRSVGPTTLRLPTDATEAHGVTTVPDPSGPLTITFVPGPSDVMGDSFRRGLIAGCGCAVVDRTTTWVDATPAVRYHLQIPSTDASLPAVAWAIPTPGGVLAMTWTAGGPAAHSATAEAIVALIDLPEADAAP